VNLVIVVVVVVVVVEGDGRGRRVKGEGMRFARPAHVMHKKDQSANPHIVAHVGEHNEKDGRKVVDHHLPKIIAPLGQENVKYQRVKSIPRVQRMKIDTKPARSQNRASE